MRLIDADALIVSKHWAVCTCPAQVIQKAPTIEAEPVRHGELRGEDGWKSGIKRIQEVAKLDWSMIEQYGSIAKEVNELQAEIDTLKKDSRSYNHLITVLEDQIDHLWRLREDFEARLSRLSSLERRILRKKYLEGKTYKDIALDLNYSVDTVKKYRKAAMEKMED